jgi:hypothetical protein
MARYCLDSAVTFFGSTVRAALRETVKIQVGKETYFEPKYEVEQILEPDFYLPRPPSRKQRRFAVGEQLRAMLDSGTRDPHKVSGKPKLPKSLLVQLEERGIFVA